MTEETPGGAAKPRASGWIAGLAIGGAVALAAWYFGLSKRPVPIAEVPAPAAVPAPEPSATAAPATAAPEPAAAPETASAPATGSASEPNPELAAPSEGQPDFDTVRVEPDGQTLVAGHAAPGAKVRVMVDGAEAATAEADGRGEFVMLFALPPSAEPRVMRLETADGAAASEAEVIVAPFEGVAVAATEPAAPASAAPTGTEEAAAEPAAPQVLIVDDSGVRPASAAPVAGIVIDTIGYAANGDVTLAGRGQPGSFARAYLDNAGIATLPIGDDGLWHGEISGIAPGLYTLRVDQVGADGKVTARFETPFQREAPETVAAALPPLAPPAPPPVLGAPAPAATAPQPAPEPVPVRPVSVTVQPGFTLWRIARENYGDGVLYVKVFEANKDQIRNPDLIYPGQIFTVPGE